VTEIQARVERYAIRQGESGFTDAKLCEDLGDDGSTLRTRRSELSDRNIILDSGQRTTHGDSERRRIVWLHRNFVRNAPPIIDRPSHASDQERTEALNMVGEIFGFARQMRNEGRTQFAQRLDRAAELMAKLAR
jgi:hypothetical protein